MHSEKGSRWSLFVPPEAALPAGSKEYLQSAVQTLGNFHWERKAPTEAGRARFHLNPAKLAEEFATEQVTKIAVDYNRNDYLAANSPRRKSVVENLRKVEEMSAELSAFLENLDDETRLVLHRAAKEWEQQDRPRDADPWSLPRVFRPKLPDIYLVIGDEKPNSAGEWVNTLAALSQRASHALGHLQWERGITDMDRPDTGGRTSLWLERNGSPGLVLIRDCWEIYDLFKPGSATAALNGRFDSFVTLVYGYATGRHRKESQFNSHLAPVVRNCRRLRGLYEANLSDLNECRDLRSPKELSAAERAQLSKLEKNIARRKMEQSKLKAELFMFA